MVELLENVGFGARVNAGVAAGDGDAIVLVNDDMFVEPGFVEAIARAARGPARRDGRRAHARCRAASWSTASGSRSTRRWRRTTGCGCGPPGAAPGRARSARAAARAAYRRSAFEQAGGFDDALFAYGEDVDLALRLRAAGWRAAAAPDARGVHLGGATFGVDSPRQRRLARLRPRLPAAALRRAALARPRRARSLIEALVVGWGLVRHRTLVPLTRARGRLARRGPAAAAGATRGRRPLDHAREAVRRLARAR